VADYAVSLPSAVEKYW